MGGTVALRSVNNNKKFRRATVLQLEYMLRVSSVLCGNAILHKSKSTTTDAFRNSAMVRLCNSDIEE